MATIFELTGEARDQRIAELMKRMQDAAKVQMAAHSGGSADEPAAPAPTPAATASVATSAPSAAQSATTAPATATATAASAAPTPAPKLAGPKTRAATTTQAEEGPTNAEMSRREFLTYSWGGALGLLTAVAGVQTYFFLYPRFREGEFGGTFNIGAEAALPPTDAPPQGIADGKFWLVNTEEEGPKAIYMVCTHLGCLYKWEPANNRFECPCHGSKFTRDGHYISGPAGRSLDRFDVAISDTGDVLVDTGAKIVGDSKDLSPALAPVTS